VGVVDKHSNHYRLTLILGQLFRAAISSIGVGSTDTQSLIGGGIYDFVRQGLVFGASNSRERVLYSQFPAGSITTDIGQTDIMISPSADFRALGLIDPVADPQGELPFFGPPPAIGFNSGFPLDFDPSNGIDPDKLDFDGIATHEIGHVLGFSSSVGLSELIPGFPPVPSVLDLFRFRPHVNLPSFVLRSESCRREESKYFRVEPELEFSTGRPDGTGGDGSGEPLEDRSQSKPTTYRIMVPGSVLASAT
jgi:hypothetical protein